MSSPASIKNHPIHPMLIAFPIGLWVFALVGDLIRLGGGGPDWGVVSLYCTIGGIAGAILAAVPGLIDYFSIDEPAMGRIATYHMLLNLGALAIFSLDLWARLRAGEDSKLPFVLCLLGVILLGFGGWLGGEMVYVKGMAVEAVEKAASKPKKHAA